MKLASQVCWPCRWLFESKPVAVLVLDSAGLAVTLDASQLVNTPRAQRTVKSPPQSTCNILEAHLVTLFASLTLQQQRPSYRRRSRRALSNARLDPELP